MIKNRTAQLVFQTIYCTLGLVGIVASFGVFDDITLFRWDFYVYFTNISNFLCIGVMFACLIQTIKKKEDSFVTTSPLMKFIGMLGILLTSFVVLGFVFFALDKIGKRKNEKQIIVLNGLRSVHSRFQAV